MNVLDSILDEEDSSPRAQVNIEIFLVKIVGSDAFVVLWAGRGWERIRRVGRQGKIVQILKPKNIYLNFVRVVRET